MFLEYIESGLEVLILIDDLKCDLYIATKTNEGWFEYKRSFLNEIDLSKALRERVGLEKAYKILESNGIPKSHNLFNLWK